MLRQTYTQHQQQRQLTDGERGIVQDLLRAQDNDRDLLNLISRIAVLVAPVTGDTREEQQASITEYATKHHLLLETLAAGNLTCDEAGTAASLTEGLLRLLQLRHNKLSRERFGAFRITSIDDGGGGKVHRWLNGSQQPDTLYSSLFGALD